MKKILLSIVMLITLSTMLGTTQTVWAQKYFTKSGFTAFQASVEAFEPVEAETHSTTAIMNLATGEVAALLFVKAFDFEIALMQEHFNENYMLSDKYPKAFFKGKLLNFNADDLTSTDKQFTLSGELNVKGKKKSIEDKIWLRKEGDSIHVAGNLTVLPGDFDISIPSIVRNKISQEIAIEWRYELAKKK